MSTDVDLSECAACLCLASRRAARTVTRAFDRRLRPHGIRATQFSMLSVLILGGGSTIGVLADRLGTERTTLTRNLALVEREGWIAIRPGADGRERIVEATAAGRRKVEKALAAWADAQAAAKVALGSAGAAALRRLAERPLR